MERSHPAGWNVLGSDIVIDTPHLRLRRDRIALPDGRGVGEYYVRESRGYSVVLALTETGDAVLVRQYKHGIGESVLELPAGGIDPGESAAACAARELAEETGYVCAPGALEFVRTFIADPTNSTSRYHLYIAHAAEPLVAQHFDVLEDIAVELVSLATLRRFVRDGTIDVGPQVAAIYHALDRLDRL